jgi:phosphate acetyltransferase
MQSIESISFVENKTFDEMKVTAPTEKIKRPRTEQPDLPVHQNAGFYRALLERTQGLEPLCVAVVHPVDRNALVGAVEAARAGLILPTFIGPESKIRARAWAENIDISRYVLVATDHSHAAAARGVAMARNGEADALM